MKEMVARNATNFLITGIPDVGLIPRYDLDFDRALEDSPGGELERSQLATLYSKMLDDLIREEVVPALRATGVNVTYAPLADVTDSAGELIEEGALSSILPSLAELYDIPLQELVDTILAHQEKVFFDHVHPTAQVHALVGSLIHATLEGMEWIENGPISADSIDLSFEGSIATAGKVDTFTVSLRKGQVWTFEMLGMSTLGDDGSLADPLLQILDPRGKVLTDFLEGSGEDSGFGFDAHLSFTAERNGDYTIVAGATGSLTGDYLIQGAMADVVVASAFTFEFDFSSYGMYF